MQYVGTTALVTGASGGLGAEFARQLAVRGCDVVLVARRERPLEQLAERIRADTGRQAHVLVADLAAEGVGDRLLAALEQRGLQVDTVINNAGLGMTKPFRDMSSEEIKGQLRVNVDAVVDITRALLPQLTARGRGALVNIASLTGHGPMPGMAVYAASKAFVMRFTEAVGYELRHSELTVLAFSPGPTRTEFYRTSGSSEGGVKFQAPPEVVRNCLRALDRRATPLSTGSGWRNRFAARLLTVLPPRRAAQFLDSTPAG